MIRVVHIVPSLGAGGAETMLANLLARTDPQRCESRVVTLAEAGGPVAERIAALGIPVYRCHMRPGVPGLVGIARLAQHMRGLRPDLVQGWMYHGNLAALAAAAACGGRTPAIWNIRAANHLLGREKPGTALAIWMGGRLSRRAAAIVGNSSSGARLHQEHLGYRRDGWSIIPNGFDTDRFAPWEEARRSVREELGIPWHSVLVGLVARNHPVKDHTNFLRAAALVHSLAPEAHFLMAGAGVDTNPGFLRQTTALGIGGNVHMLGERADTHRINAALDVACSASWSEAFPMAIGEAMACGVPCVVTDVGDSSFLVDRTGTASPARDPQKLAAAMLDLLGRGDGDRRALGLAARQRILQHFSIDAVVERYLDLYSTTLRARGVPRVKQCAA